MFRCIQKLKALNLCPQLHPLQNFFPINETNKVTLKWVIISEEVEQTYSIEKSTDGINYTLLEAQKSFGQSAFPLNYGVLDKKPNNAGVTHYRLTQQNANENITYTNVQSIDRSLNNTAQLQVYTNPVNDVLDMNISSKSDAEAILFVYDITGKIVLQKALQLKEGEQSISMSLADLKEGFYILNLNTGGKSINKKIIKQ